MRLLLQTGWFGRLLCAWPTMEYGGLRHTEMMGLQVEMCESAPEGVFVTQQRIDKRNSKFLVPRKKNKDVMGDVS